MRSTHSLRRFCLLSTLATLLLATRGLRADGTETLGPASITIEPGTDTVSDGVGLVDGSGIVDLEILPTATVVQVLLYWNGFDLALADGGDDTIAVDGNSVTGALIGGVTEINPNLFAYTYRADITSLGLVGPGSNSLTIDGADFTKTPGGANGASVVVIIDDGVSPLLAIGVRDGQDWAYINSPSPLLDRTVPQTFTFPPSPFDRIMTLTIIAGSVQGPASGGSEIRPSIIRADVEGVVTDFVDRLASNSGNEWDHIPLEVEVAAGASSLTLEILSEGDGSGRVPASLVWILGLLAQPPLPCRVTGGGIVFPEVRGNGRRNGNGRQPEPGNVYSFGGQAGAPTAFPPQPRGEWTHHQINGPDGSFTFHAGTSSAPPGTEIDLIVCSDPGYCRQARPAPAKQIDFEGIGSFRNIRNPSDSLGEVVARSTHHWFEVHIEDLGEPGRAGRTPPPGQCPPGGSAGQVADCDCPDFYSIKIYAGFDPETEAVNRTDLIYEEATYITGGNFQIHPPTGFDARGLGAVEQSYVSPPFRRGDVDSDAQIGVRDGVSLIRHLFVGESELDCPKTGDVDDSGDLTVADGIFILDHLFLGGHRPAEPFADCGIDVTGDSLSCESYSACD